MDNEPKDYTKAAAIWLGVWIGGGGLISLIFWNSTPVLIAIFAVVGTGIMTTLAVFGGQFLTFVLRVVTKLARRADEWSRRP